MKRQRRAGVDPARRRFSPVDFDRSDVRRHAGRLFEHGGRQRLGSLDGIAQRPIPGDVGQRPDGATDAEQHRVEGVLGDAVVPLDHAGLGVDVGPGVLGLAVLHQHVGRHLVDHVDHLEQRVVRQVLQAELPLRRVARVGLAQHGVAVARDHLAAVQRVPQRRLDDLGGRLLAAELFHEGLGPAQHLLVGQSVQRSGQAVDAGRQRVVDIGQGRRHQVHGVRRDIARLVVGMQDEVHPRHVVVRCVDAHHVGEVAAEVQVGIRLVIGSPFLNFRR